MHACRNWKQWDVLCQTSWIGFEITISFRNLTCCHFFFLVYKTVHLFKCNGFRRLRSSQMALTCCISPFPVFHGCKWVDSDTIGYTSSVKIIYVHIELWFTNQQDRLVCASVLLMVMSCLVVSLLLVQCCLWHLCYMLQIYQDFHTKFGKLNKKVVLLTGETATDLKLIIKVCPLDVYLLLEPFYSMQLWRHQWLM